MGIDSVTERSEVDDERRLRSERSAMTLVPLGDADGRTRWEITHDGRIFAVFVTRDGPVVADGLCPHRQGRLSDGLIRDGAVVCPSHWYVFDLGTGRCRTTSDYTLARYPVTWRDGVAYADIPPAQTRSWSDILRAHAAGHSTH